MRVMDKNSSKNPKNNRNKVVFFCFFFKKNISKLSLALFNPMIPQITAIKEIELFLFKITKIPRITKIIAFEKMD